MAKSKTSFDKDKQPVKRKPRGQSERTKILDAMKRKGKTETGFYDELITRAFNPDDNFTFKEVLARMSPIPKAVSPLYQFTFNEKAEPHVKASQVLKAMADGVLPSDIGALYISGIQSMLKIKEVTDIDDFGYVAWKLLKNAKPNDGSLEWSSSN